MDQDRFEKLKSEGCNRIPVYRTVLADLDTPLSVYLKLADGPDSYLFESVEGGETWGRYSIIGLPCKRRYTVHGNTIRCRDFGRLVEEESVADPLARINELKAGFNVPHRNLQFGTDQSCGHGGIDIAINQDQVWPFR